MKKFLLITLLSVFAFGYTADAQIGFKLGYLFSKQTGEVAGLSTLKDAKKDDYKKSQGAMCAGVFFDSKLAPLIGLRVGLDYAPKGYKIKSDKLEGLGSLGEIEANSKINYLEIPVLAKVKIGPVYGLGGVYAAYAINGKFSIDKVPDIVQKYLKPQDYDFDDKDYKRMDYGLKFGAGLQMGLGPLHAFAQVEYSYGLANISQIKDFSAHNSALAITVGVLLGM